MGSRATSRTTATVTWSKAAIGCITEGLEVGHLRLVIGSSMGGMHAWMWAEMYPDLMDGVVALSCQPVEISGRNWIGAARRGRGDPPRPGLEQRLYEKNPRHYIYSAAATFTHREPDAHPGDGADPAPPPTSSTSAGSPRRPRATPTTSSGRSRRSRTTTPSPTSTRSRPRCC